MEILQFDQHHWNKVKTNLEVFFKVYICPALLGFKPIIFCANCDKVLLQDDEIHPSEDAEMKSIQCDLCSAWSHYKYENIHVADIASKTFTGFALIVLVTLAT